MLDVIKKKLIGEVVQDIVTIGFIDTENGVNRYYPNLQWLYFQVTNSIIEFASVEQYSKLMIQLVNEIKFNFEIDEDMKPCFSSILNVTLTEGDMSSGHTILNLDFINLVDNKEFIICDALKITLKNKEIIFLDPTFLHGISIGGIEQERFWKENFTAEYITTN